MAGDLHGGTQIFEGPRRVSQLVLQGGQIAEVGRHGGVAVAERLAVEGQGPFQPLARLLPLAEAAVDHAQIGQNRAEIGVLLAAALDGERLLQEIPGFREFAALVEEDPQ